MTMRWIRTTMLAVLGSVAAAGIGVATVSSTASAHTELTGSDPTSGAALATSPTTVTLTFSEDIGPDFTAVAVRGVDGSDHPTSAARVTGPHVSADVANTLPAGGYVVNYRVVSADGHPISGQVSFSVTGPSTSPSTAADAPTTAPTVTSAAAPADADASGGDDTPWLWIAIFAALEALAGTGIVVVQKRRQRDS